MKKQNKVTEQNKIMEQNKIAEQNIGMVGEAMPAYQPDLSALREKSANKPTGDKTLEDYLSLPEDVRVEMIDGVFYDMAAPTLQHQEAAGFLYHALRNFINKNGGKCVPFIAPTDVQLFCNDKTIVQPDVFVVCDRSKLTPARVVGAPDLVVEVISPNSWYHDFYLKMEKYQEAGVREYWLVFPEDKEVIVYDFEKDRHFRRYTFEEKVPVAIWNGKCEVDFKELYESVPSLYQTEDQNVNMVEEALPVYQPDLSALRETFVNKRIGDKTLEDYLALPEDVRVEMIDGVFYDMSAPTIKHQEIAGRIYHEFINFVNRNGGRCIPLAAPTDVQLFCGNKTIVQPDVLVVCDRSKLTPARVFGAPDLVVEVISPSNWRKDVCLKTEKYREAGVREYWLVFPDKKEVIVYDFERDQDFRKYTFEEKVPVAIWNGKCEVDFKELYGRLLYLYEPGEPNVNTVEEAMPAYQPALSALREKSANKPTGDKTLEDYLALPEDVRVEMIDGVFYDMSAPTIKHQRISGRIYQEISNFIDRNGGRCIPLAAPTDVQLFCDNKTIVQPDVLVVCDKGKLTPARVFGAPDLVVEVISPSNWRKDVYLKTEKYREAGVREYWLVFPEKKEVIVYDFERELDCKKYSFEEKVPVTIWNGECEVDFKKLYENIRYLYETENETDKKNEIRIAEDPT